MKNQYLSTVKLFAEFDGKFSTSILPETVRRVLREARLRGRSARKKLFVSAKKWKRRLSFAKSMINKPETYWNNVLFAADENKFNVFGFDGCWNEKCHFIIFFVIANTSFHFKLLVVRIIYGSLILHKPVCVLLHYFYS